jgi:antitoxin component YwqK of YwqJK toxin-antitoxin module
MELAYSDSCSLDGTRILYHPDSSIYVLSSYQSAKLNGVEIWYHPEGILHHVSNYLNGNLSGPYVLFYENGVVHEAGRFETNFRVGLWSSFYANSSIMSKGEYYADYMDVYANRSFDTLLFFDTNNMAIRKVPYADTIKSIAAAVGADDICELAFPVRIYAKDGEWIYYDDEGNIISREFYKKGKYLRKEE